MQLLERVFKLTEHKTNVRTELVAGLKIGRAHV